MAKDVSSSKDVLLAKEETEKTDEEITPELDCQEEIEFENPLDPIPIEVKLFEYSWVDQVQKELDKKSNRRIWLIARDFSFNGIIGLVKSLKREPEGERIRCLFNVDDCDDDRLIEKMIENNLTENDSTNDDTSDQLKALIDENLIRKDLAINVIKNGVHGSYRQLAFTQKLSEETEYAVLDILTKGDLNSFQWVKSPMKENYEHPKLLYPTVDERFGKPLMLNIYYSSINFKDVMGKNLDSLFF